MIRNDEGAPHDKGPNAEGMTSSIRQGTVPADYVQRWNESGPDDATAFVLGGDAAPKPGPVGPYATGAPAYGAAEWTGVIPLRQADKIVAVKNVTGRDGKQTRPDQYAGDRALELFGEFNLGLRMPRGLIGLDIDAGYDGKTGAASLEALEKRFGKLPQTYSSTARGKGPSRIMFFTVPEDCGELSPYTPGFKDIDVIQHHHRYAAVWPSVHPKTQQTYRWYTPDGELLRDGFLPPRDAFAALPAEWLEYLAKPQISAEAGAGLGVEDFISRCTSESEPELMEYLTGRFNPSEGSRHDTMLQALGWAARAAADGKVNAERVFSRLEELWDRATDGRGQEFNDLLTRAVKDAPEPRDLEDEELAAAERMMAEFLDSEELDAIKPPEYLIKGWLTRDSLNRIVGEPNSGKSLVALDWAGCVGAGIPWNKHPVKQGTVVYVIAEGVRGFTKRKRAWEIQYGRTMTGVKFYPKPIEVVGRQFGTLAESPEWRTFRRVMQTIRPTLIVLDTQRRVSSEASENDNTDMGRVVKVLEALRAETGACVLLVHHTPKGGEGGAGAGAVLAAVNSEFMMTKRGHGVTAAFKLMNEKEKDEADGYGVHMALRVHTTRAADPFDEHGDGEPETSVVLEQAEQDSPEAEQVRETNVQRLMRLMDEAGMPTDLSFRASKGWLAAKGIEIPGRKDDWGEAWSARKQRAVPLSPVLKDGGTGGTLPVPVVSPSEGDS